MESYTVKQIFTQTRCTDSYLYKTFLIPIVHIQTTAEVLFTIFLDFRSLVIEPFEIPNAFLIFYKNDGTKKDQHLRCFFLLSHFIQYQFQVILKALDHVDDYNW